MIFVQIAAYREPELLATIGDCLAQAKFPGDLRFGVCWQRDEADASMLPFRDDRRFRVDDVRWQDSQGLCWARSRIQRLYDGEEFTLQLDAHHRFDAHWDEKLLKYLELSGSPKPILTSYAGMYDPASNLRISIDPFKMVAEKFTPSGTILFRPQAIREWRELAKPVPARFVSGHFFFTLGAHCQEYRYDPSLYFAGDEISLSIRSYTLGYDLFHPHRTVIWHEYTRAGRVKHWDDHTKAAVELAWHERDAISKRRLRKLLREERNDEDITGYDLGTVRSHRDYEGYAGIGFAARLLHPDTLKGSNPPNSASWEVSGEKWFDSLHCRSGAHCTGCRHDPSFRESLVRAGLVGERDFECPFGMSPPSPHEGPGTRLARLLKRLGFRYHPGCGCHDQVLRMNLAGAPWCRDNIEEILSVMRKAAADPVTNPMRIPFIDWAARKMILHCAKE